MAYALDFGKHKGKTLEWLFFHDPSYVWWMIDKEVARRFDKPLRRRFGSLVWGAMNLAVPGKCRHCDRPVSLMSLTKDTSGRLVQVDFVCDKCPHCDESPHVGGSGSLLTTPAFFFPESFKSYDERGGKFLVDCIKYAYYGKDVQMTQEKMEEFFDEPSNFVKPSQQVWTPFYNDALLMKWIDF